MISYRRVKNHVFCISIYNVPDILWSHVRSNFIVFLPRNTEHSVKVMSDIPRSDNLQSMCSCYSQKQPERGKFENRKSTDLNNA